MTNKTGGKKVLVAFAAMLMLAAMAAGPAMAVDAESTSAQERKAVQAGEHPAAFLKGFFTAAIDVANHAAQATSDTVHHNGRNVMDTVAKARGFVRDTVSGVLGNARKLSGMVGDVMPFTEHNHYEAGAQPREKAAKAGAAE